MSGIFGSWNLDGDPLPIDRLRACADRISPCGIGDIQISEAGMVGLAAKTIPHRNGSITTSRSGERGQVAGVFDGRLDNRDDLITALRRRRSVHDASTNCELVLAAYTEVQRSIRREPSRRFQLCRVRSCFESTAPRTRPVGCPPALLYPGEPHIPVCERGEDAPGLARRQGHTQRTDAGGLRAPVSRHRQPDLHVLSRHSVAAARSPADRHAGGVDASTVFDFDTERRIRFQRFEAYVEAFHSLFAASVRKRLRSTTPVAISVSGGLDSAYIFAVAQQLARDGAAPCPAVRGFNYAGAPGTPSYEEEYHSSNRARDRDRDRAYSAAARVHGVCRS